MYVGETIQVSVTDTRGVAFTASAGTLTVTAPDGTETSPTVTITPGTAALSQALSAMVTPTMGGRYALSWSYGDSAGETIIKKGERYATWTDAEGLSRFRLRSASSAMSQYVFEREFSSVARGLLSRWPQIGNGLGTAATMGVYNLLSNYDDQCFFDEAVALTVCARVVGPLTTNGAASDQASNKFGDSEQKFALSDTRPEGSPGDTGAGPGGYAGNNERVRWIKEAAEKLGRVSFVQQSISARGNFNPFRIHGPTREKYAHGQVQTLLSDVIWLLSDKFDLEPAMQTTGY